MIPGRLRNRSSRGAAPRGAAGFGTNEATASDEPRLPFAGYESLSIRQLQQELPSHSQIELEAAESYERSHKRRQAVLNKLRYLRGGEPLPGYDALAVDEILAALEDADLATLKKVRGYERKFHQRTRVLDEVVRIQRTRRTAETVKAVPAYVPASAGSRADPNSDSARARTT